MECYMFKLVHEPSIYMYTSLYQPSFRSLLQLAHRNNRRLQRLFI